MESLGQILLRMGTRSRSVRQTEDVPQQANLPSSTSCMICGDIGWLSPNVPTMHPEFGQARPCTCLEFRSNQLRRTMALERPSNLGALRQATFSSANPSGPGADTASQQKFTAALTAATRFAEDTVGWITFAGPSGSGKTYLAAAIANHQIDRGHPALLITASDLLDQLRNGFAEGADASFGDMFDKLRNTPLLILDDLPTRLTTPWGQERLFQLMAHRHSEQLPTVITLRGDPEQLDDFLRTRLETADGFARIYTLGLVANLASRNLGGIPANMRERMTFESFQIAANGSLTEEERRAVSGTHAYVQRWAERNRPDGWLLLLGPCGVGKTHLAVAAAVERQNRGDDVFFATVADLLDQLRGTFSEDSPIAHADMMQRIRTSQLLVLDDMGSERHTPFAEDKLFQIVNYRYEERLPTIVTTSAFPAELDNMRPRIASRLLDSMVVTMMVMEGPDYRRRPVGGTSAR